VRPREECFPLENSKAALKCCCPLRDFSRETPVGIIRNEGFHLTKIRKLVFDGGIFLDRARDYSVLTLHGRRARFVLPQARVLQLRTQLGEPRALPWNVKDGPRRPSAARRVQ
jgi:hypothetical protein